jgi:hypothetical protein
MELVYISLFHYFFSFASKYLSEAWKDSEETVRSIKGME